MNFKFLSKVLLFFIFKNILRQEIMNLKFLSKNLRNSLVIFFCSVFQLLENYWLKRFN